MTKNLENCPLCRHSATGHYHSDKKRPYISCSNCHLIFVPQQYLPLLKQERAIYDLHNNDVNDPGYRRFLNRLIEPLKKHIKVGDRGLDFGCGPGPALSMILEEQGYAMDNYDPYYSPEEGLLKQHYQFICSTEVLEHIHQPMPVLLALWQQLKPSGVLAIMTKRATTQTAFKSWHYINDPTHVRFYSDKTFKHIAQLLNAELYLPEKDVAILVKKSA